MDYSISLCVVGPISVGKTTLIKKLELLLRDSSIPIGNVQPSIMAEITRVEFKIKDKILKANITDTPGMKKLFHALPGNILRNNCGYLIVFDLTDRESFTDIKEWFEPIKEYCPHFAEIFLVGNKTDAFEKRAVMREEAESLAAAMNARYFETSSKAGSGVVEMFQNMVENIVRKVEFGTLNRHDRGHGIRHPPQGGADPESQLKLKANNKKKDDEGSFWKRCCGK